MTIEIVVGDELIEVEEGAESLAFYVHRAKEAQDQQKAWGRHEAIAKAAIDALQAEKKASYETGSATLIVSKRNGRSNFVVDKVKLANAELTGDERLTLISAANSFSREAVDPGLKNTDPAKWKPTTFLGELFASCLTKGEPGKGFIVIETGTKYAP